MSWSSGAQAVAPCDRTWLEWALSPIADIRRDEVAGALLMTALMFC